jgi:3-oxoacyl-[acyl-carrier protein] reductase
MTPSGDLSGRVALVTGGATGIGRACVERFAEGGADVVVNFSRSAEDAEATAEQARAAGVRASIVKADVSDERAVHAMVHEALATFGRIDYLVNSAGTTKFVPEADLAGLAAEDWDRIFAVNVRGLFNCCSAVSEELRKAGGAIVNVGSASGFTGKGSSVPYAASKAAVSTLTKSLARALAPQVRVNAVAPGIVDTRWVAGREEHVRRLSEATPLGRVCTPEEIAVVIHFLAVEASFVTGQTVVIDGGAFL